MQQQPAANLSTAAKAIDILPAAAKISSENLSGRGCGGCMREGIEGRNVLGFRENGTASNLLKGADLSTALGYSAEGLIPFQGIAF